MYIKISLFTATTLGTVNILQAQKVTRHLGGSPGLVAKSGDSCSEDGGFESQHRRQDGIFSHLFELQQQRNIRLKLLYS